MFGSLQKRELQLNRYTLCGFAAILLWSTTIAVIRSLSEQVGPITSAASVYLLGGFLSLVPISYSRTRIEQVRAFSRLYLLGCGSLFIFYMLVVYLAVGLASNRQQVLEVGLINYLWPALTLFFSVFLLGKSAQLSLIPGTILGFFGAFLVLTQSDTVSWTSFSRNVMSNFWAYSLALMASVSWGLYSHLSRRWGGAVSGNAVPFFMMATGIILLFVRFFFPEQTLWTLKSIGEALFMSLATLFSYIFWDQAMRKGDMVLVAASSYFIPFLSTLVSSLYLGITAGLRLWLGGGCIILGSLISWASVSDRGPR